MTQHYLTRVAASVAIATASMAASAGVIDFTSNAWSGANGLNSYGPLNGVTLTALPNGPLNLQRLTFNAGPCGNTLVGLACQGAGIGVGPVDPTQINVLPEALRVGFSSAQSIWGVDFLKFVSTTGFLGYSEQMQIRASTDGTNFGAWQTFIAPSPSATGGYYSAGFRADNVLALEIAGNTFGLNVLSAASLARITVPVPATLPLIGLGLAAFGGLSLRRRSA